MDDASRFDPRELSATALVDLDARVLGPDGQRSRSAPTAALLGSSPLSDLTVPIASREDLMKMKRATGRPQDLADVKVLESLG